MSEQQEQKEQRTLTRAERIEAKRERDVKLGEYKAKFMKHVDTLPSPPS